MRARDPVDRKVVINFTLDNYIKVYLYNGDDVVSSIKEGYLIDNVTINWNTIQNITHNGIEIEPEYLTENIVYDETDPVTGLSTRGIKDEEIPYVYEASNKIKVYFDETAGDAPFILEGYRRVDLTEEKKYFKKITIPYKYKDNGVLPYTNETYREIYQDLVTGNWYEKEPNADLTPLTITDLPNPTIYGIINSSDKKIDYSAINYCVESYIFTKWIKGLKIDNSAFNGDFEDPDSAFNIERRNVIKNALSTNLDQSIASYSNHMTEQYIMPVLSDLDWDQILSNVSIITFVQNMPIGLKKYNNYVVATSDLNMEYVDPNGIYLSDLDKNDDYYHKLDCNELTSTNIIGYRNTDYVAKSYPTGTIDPTSGNEIINYYYLHTKGNIINEGFQSCDYCMIQRDLFTETATNKDAQQKAYTTALIREKYAAKRIKLPQACAAPVDHLLYS